MSGEKTEQPTPHKIRKAREEGQVAKSKDFTQTVLIGCLFGYTLADSQRLLSELATLMLFPADLYDVSFSTGAAMLFMEAGTSLISIMIPYLLIVFLVGTFVEAWQTGFLISFKVLKPKGERLNPVTNLKQMFSMKNIIEFVKSNLKVVILVSIIYLITRGAIDDLVKIPPAGVAAAGVLLAAVMKKLIIFTFIFFAFIALVDMVYQRYEYLKNLRMSIDEIKQEYKQLEGNPEIKGHRKQLAREIIFSESVNKTKKATVVVSNPTHLAVSLYFHEGETPLPIVLNKGKGYMAQEIMKIAREAGIPVMQNIPLARRLMATAAVDQYIPSELVEPVAEILLELRRLAQEREAGSW